MYMLNLDIGRLTCKELNYASKRLKGLKLCINVTIFGGGYMKSRYIIFFAAAVMLFSSSFSGAYVFAKQPNEEMTDSVVKTTSKVEIRNGKIVGERVGYYLQIPEAILEYITAEREIYGTNQPLLEKINLYCNPDLDPKYPESPKLLGSLYAFKKLAWSSNLGCEEIFRTKDYVFAFEKKENTFSYEYYRNVFKFCISRIGSVDLMKECLTLPPNQTIEFSYTVFVVGKPLKNKVQVVGTSYLVPLREVSEALGYKVSWNAATNTVTVQKGATKDSFVAGPNTTTVRGYQVKIIKDRTYISPGYFVRLGNSLEMDSNKNIYFAD